MKVAKTLARISALVAAVALVPVGTGITHAATGNLVGSVTFSQPCDSYLGTGITFDGTNLWYSCWASQNDLFRADPHSGQVTGVYQIENGLGAIAYDPTRNAIWAGYGGGDPTMGQPQPKDNPGDVVLIQLDGNKNVTGSAVKFNGGGDIDGSSTGGCTGLIDGMAYDASKDSLDITTDCGGQVVQYSTSGSETGLQWWANANNQPQCTYNLSGVALTGQALIENNNTCNNVFAVDKSTGQPLFNFSTQVAGDQNARGMGLTCDASTFGKDVIWSRAAGGAMPHAYAFEAPAGTCAANAATPTTLTLSATNAGSGDFDDAATFSATLTTTTGTPVAGATVQFTAGTQTCNGTTNAAGVATCTMTLTQPAGAYTLKASFAGDASHKASGSSAGFTVNGEETVLTPTPGTLYIAQGGPATMSSVLTEDGTTPLANQAVTMVLGSGNATQSCVGFTDATGTARCTIPQVTLALGQQAVSATFGGTNYFKASSDPNSAIVYAYPASGTFLLGDKSAAVNSTVTFWGSAWGRQNSFSAGSVQGGFFGFADQGSQQHPTCGSTWTGTAGGSSKPPTTVPSYMMVAVTSNPTKSGSSTTGTVSAVEVVRTNGGYNGSPGSAGTGTVVGVICHS